MGSENKFRGGPRQIRETNQDKGAVVFSYHLFPSGSPTYFIKLMWMGRWVEVVGPGLGS